MNLAKVCLGPGRHCCLVDLGTHELKLEDRVVVQRDDGLGLGRVTAIFRDVESTLIPGNLKPLVRPATPEDLAQAERNREVEERAYRFCQERIEVRQLPIYLVRVEALFDTSKVVFFFTAPGRVDFRDLVKDLVQEFRTRIELRQIGVRHRAKMVGGLGICGRALCCASFLHDFEPVSVRMAKEQQLSLNPSKISGICGRLMCCLTYEYSTYQEIRRHLPRLGRRVKLPEGEGKVIRYNLIRQTATLEMEEGGELEVPLADLPGNENK
ncbi:MAG: stage 0 sporulation protein [Deltaproteobacteria bacterium]|nr:MAG: stage 0 sporulation protein [Deltaproteobacteria bacterium]